MIRKTIDGIRRRRVDLIVLAAYTALTVGMTWPLLSRLGSHFAGRNIDVWLNQWATWWTERALVTGQSLYHTDLMFYPHGVSLAFHSFSHVNTALAWLMRPWLGDLAAHNVTVLLAHILSGYGTFCLVREIMRPADEADRAEQAFSGGAFFAGLVFAFFPYRMAESAHPVIFSTQWIPLYFLFFMRLVQRARRRDVLLAALFFVLTALSSWHLMIFAALLSALYLGYLGIWERWRPSKAALTHLALLALLCGSLLAPFLLPLLREQLTTASPYVGVDLTVGKGNDPLAFLLPAEEHPALGRLAIPWHARIKSIQPAYLGLTVLALSIMGRLTHRRRARFWVLLALLSALLSLEFPLQIGGHVFGWAAPWAKPIVGLLRHPFRFNVLIGLALAVLSGLGGAALLRRIADVRWRWLTGGVATLLLLFEYLYFPFPTVAAETPRCYAQLAAESESGAVLELPMGRVPNRYYLYYQMTHGLPLVEGIVSRTSHEAYRFIQTTPILRALQDCGSQTLPPIDPAGMLGDLADLGIDYVVLHKHLVNASSLDLWSNVRTSAPECEDAHVAVYRTRAAPRDFSGAPQLVEACVAVQTPLSPPLSVSPGETVPVPLEWIIGQPPRQEYVLELAVVEDTGAVTRRPPSPVVPGAAMMDWHAGKRHLAHYAFTVDTLVPPGTYRLRATLVPLNRAGEIFLTSDIARVHLDAGSEPFSPPTTQERMVDAAFGSDIVLTGYELEIGHDAVHLNLNWRALQPMAVDYKFFVHVYDVESEAPVVQVDTMPQDWTYPTTAWGVGETVSDGNTLSLAGLSAGTYQLGIGIYDPHTGERLTISNPPTPFITDAGRLFLPEQIVR